VPCVVSGANCNEAHNEDRKSKISRHITATQTPQESAPLTAEIPDDLKTIVSAWPTLPDNIRAAILALAAVKP